MRERKLHPLPASVGRQPVLPHGSCTAHTRYFTVPAALSIRAQKGREFPWKTPDLLGIEMSAALPTTPAVAPLFHIEVTVDDAQDMRQLLDQAIHQLIPTALERKQGILVTQIFPKTPTRSR